MKVLELIEYLKTFNQDLPVWFTVTYDPESCFNELKEEDIKASTVATYTDDGDIEKELPALIIGENRIC